MNVNRKMHNPFIYFLFIYSNCFIFSKNYLMAFASVRACILIYFFLIFLLVLPCTLYNLEAMVLGLINGT